MGKGKRMKKIFVSYQFNVDGSSLNFGCSDLEVSRGITGIEDLKATADVIRDLLLQGNPEWIGRKVNPCILFWREYDKE
jgi:hypothetical protein